MSVSLELLTLAPQTGIAFVLPAGATLRVVAVEAEQVADIALFARYDLRNAFSPGRTIDYNEHLIPVTGDVLYSNRSTPLARITLDTVGVHDVLLAPCSRDMFDRRGQRNHRNCHENLFRPLERYGLEADDVTATFNAFMDVRFVDNHMRIEAPKSREGDRLELRAETDLIVGLAACSSELTNNGRCKSIAYAIL